MDKKSIDNVDRRTKAVNPNAFCKNFKDIEHPRAKIWVIFERHDD